MEHNLEIQAQVKEQWHNVNRDYRNSNEHLQNRISLLRGTDKVLMRMHLENGYSYADLSRLAGVSQATISRRVKRIADRLTSAEINTYYRHRGDFDTSQRQICSRRNISRYRVRTTLDKLSSLMGEEYSL